MLFRQLFDRDSCTYSYLLADPHSRQAALVDPVFEHHQRDVALLRELDLQLAYVLDTHVHADHVTGAWLMRQALGARIVLSTRYGASHVDLPVDHGDVVRIGDIALEVRATPGHTLGCLTFVSADHRLALTGDCLLIRGAGRTDFQGGDAASMWHSIKGQILTLPDDCLLYPAHDYQGRTVTTVAEERVFNPRFGGEASLEDFVGFMSALGLPHPRKMEEAVPANLVSGAVQVTTGEDKRRWGPVIVTYAGIPQVDAQWVQTHLDAVLVLDVRTASEFEGEYGHIPGSRLLTLDGLRDHLDDLPRDRPIVTVCRSGRRSGQAAVILRGAGFDAVANLDGGILRWAELGLPLD